MEYNISARQTNAALKDRLQHQARQADEVAADMLRQAGDPNAIRALVGEYVRVRYGLSDADMAVSESLNYLGEASLAAGLGIPVEQVRASELDSKCENVSSSMTKKILLFIALNKALGIDLTPEQTAQIVTLSQLADEVAAQLGVRNAACCELAAKGHADSVRQL